MTAPFCSNSRAEAREDLLLEADASPQLDRALEEERRARVDRRPRMPLHDERRDAVVREEERGREPDEAAADDQDRDFALHHEEIFLDPEWGARLDSISCSSIRSPVAASAAAFATR